MDSNKVIVGIWVIFLCLPLSYAQIGVPFPFPENVLGTIIWTILVFPIVYFPTILIYNIFNFLNKKFNENTKVDDKKSD